MGRYSQERKQRFDQIKTLVAEEKEYGYDKLKSEIVVEHGLTEEKASEHLETLETADMITIEDGTVKATDQLLEEHEAGK